MAGPIPRSARYVPMPQRSARPDPAVFALADLTLDDFALALDRLPEGYREGLFEGRRWGVTLHRSPDGRRRWLWGEALGGAERVSANIYRLDEARLRLLPCEMPAETVIRFVLGFRPDP